MKSDKITSKLSTTQINTVTLDQYEEATNKWVDVLNSNGGKLDNSIILAKHYEIPLTDIMNLAKEIAALGKDGIKTIRATVGVVEYPVNASEYEMRLYFTGVDDANIPIFQNSEGESVIYDFTMPCPPTC